MLDLLFAFAAGILVGAGLMGLSYSNSLTVKRGGYQPHGDGPKSSNPPHGRGSHSIPGRGVWENPSPPDPATAPLNTRPKRIELP